MPLDPRIPLGVTPVDPNGFTNALAAGMKMRETQNESERLALAENRLARKDEAATTRNNALSTYGSSKRTDEDLARVYAVDPEAAAKLEKNMKDARLADVQAKGLQLENFKKNAAIVAEATGRMLVNPTKDNINLILDDAEKNGGADVSGPRRQIASAPDDPKVLVGYVKGWAGNALKIQEMARQEEKDGQPKQTVLGGAAYNRDPETGELSLAPGSPPPKAPTGPAPRYINTPRGQMLMDPQNPSLPGPIVEGTAPTPKPPKPPTEGQSRAGTLVGEAEHADSTMKDLEAKGYNPTSKLGAVIDRVADMGGMTTSWLASPEGQTYLTAAREFVASVAYGKSGASLTETEWENGRQTYIPMPGDSKERREFKASARARGMQGMHIQAGPADPSAHAGAEGGARPAPPAGGADPERAELERLRALKAARGGS
jgi:hypothetical protein